MIKEIYKKLLRDRLEKIMVVEFDLTFLRKAKASLLNENEEDLRNDLTEVTNELRVMQATKRKFKDLSKEDEEKLKKLGEKVKDLQDRITETIEVQTKVKQLKVLQVELRDYYNIAKKHAGEVLKSIKE